MAACGQLKSASLRNRDAVARLLAEKDAALVA